MAKKDGTNNAKIGRHSRGNSNKLQAARTERNKSKRLKLSRGGAAPVRPQDGSLDPLKRINEVLVALKAKKLRVTTQRSVAGRKQDERGVWRLTA